MIVRCGRCRTEFEVPGAGRFACPVCGTANQVGGSPDPGFVAPPPPMPEPDLPSPRATCPDCGFRFIVGEVSVASCPMCGTAVETGLGDDRQADPEGEGA